MPETIGYQAWVVNAKTGAHSYYENFNCHGIVKFNGKWIGLFADGVYELSGADDDGTPIESKIQWAASEMGTPKQKSVDSVFVNMRNFDEAAIKLTVKVDETEERTYAKDMTGHPEGIRRHRILIPKGLSGQTWQFGFENQDGGDFVLGELEVLSNELKRHLR